MKFIEKNGLFAVPVVLLLTLLAYIGKVCAISFFLAGAIGVLIAYWIKVYKATTDQNNEFKLKYFLKNNFVAFTVNITGIALIVAMVNIVPGSEIVLNKILEWIPFDFEIPKEFTEITLLLFGLGLGYKSQYPVRTKVKEQIKKRL